MITITHTWPEGTLLTGTAKGDGSYEILRPRGWRWGRSIGCWFIPNSRHRFSKQHLISTTGDALVEAGFTVEIKIDDTPESAAEVETAKAVQAEARADALDAKAARREGEAEAAWEKDRRLTDMLPPGGEPIKIGHHSEGRHRRAIDNAWKALGQAVHAEDEAKETRRRANIAADATDHRNSPIAVARRIDRLETEVRRCKRVLAGERAWTDETPSRLYLKKPTGAYKDRVEAELAVAEEQVAYWQDVRAAQQATGVATNYGKHNVKKGDKIKYRGTWYEVRRANAKSVTIPSMIGLGFDLGWTDTVPWHEIQDHQPAEQEQEALLDG
jgi:hypothetical protein